MAMVICESKVTIKGQITLPIKVMKELGISPGENIVFEQQGDAIVIKAGIEKLSVRDLHKRHSPAGLKRITGAAIKKSREDAWLQGQKAS
jgi:AbrB family looped-hinge helix DNA binding protein